MVPTRQEPLAKIAEGRERLKLFWAAEGAAFREVWASLSQEEKSKLLLGISPHMPRSPTDTVCACGCGSDLKGSAVLFPELVLELLLGNGCLVCEDGEKGVFDVGAVMERHATVNNKEQEVTDLAHISELQAKGVLKVIPLQPQLLHVLVGENRGKAIAVIEWQPEFDEGLESGVFVDPVTWEYLTKKQTGVIAFLSALADKFYTVRAVLEKRKQSAPAPS